MELSENQIVRGEERSSEPDDVPPTEHPAAGKAHRYGWVWTTCVALGLIAAAAWLLMGGHGGHAKETEASAAPREAAPVVVTVARAESRELQRSVQVVGSLYGRDEISVAAKVSGRVIALHHDIGDTVRPGDVLLEIDPTDYELAVEESRRALELELARLGLDKLPDSNFQVSKLPSVVRAQAEEQNASTRLQRVSQLARTGSVPAEEKDAAEKTVAVAQASLQQALLDAQTTLATVRHRQAALEVALQKLRDTRIVVPGDTPMQSTAVARSGESPALPAAVEYVVSRREVSEGEMITSSGAGETLLFELVMDRPLKLKATVPERHRSEVTPGQHASVQVEYFPTEVFHGEVSRVSPAVDRASRTFQVEILIPNEDRRLSAGSFAQAKIETSQDPSAVTVPEEALVTFAGVSKVFVVDGDRARDVPVTIRQSLKVAGETSGYQKSWVEVSGDLHDSELIVTSGQSQLSDGATVKVRGEEVAQTNDQ
jgi:multidrug efflux pump subunit AcrA (membrane-fusion protein)